MAHDRPNDTAAQLARAAGRFAGDKALRKRLFRAGLAGAAATANSVGRASRKLWLEVTGFLFICLAVIGGAEVWRKWETHETSKLAIAAAFAALFLYFGVTSFWRAKRTDRRP
jgi:hypothetical protein